ncbi:MAG: hypothetical protein WCJ09_22675 [Planctomycetota bacterium]
MNTIRIQHWHRHYRTSDSHASDWERLAIDTVTSAFERAAAEVVTDEREVVLLRRVALRFTADASDASPEELATQWGSAMAVAVREAIDRNDPNNVRRFADVDEHLVCYLEALVTGQHADAWYFNRMRHGDARPDAEATATFDTLLERHLERWPEVLARLSRRGLMRQVLARVSSPTLQRLWSTGIRGISYSSDPENERPVFWAALQLASRLSGRQFSSAESNAAFQTYLARPQPATDWNDPAHLAEAVYAAFRFLLQRLSVGLGAATESAASLRGRIDQTVAEFEWLDQEWLQRRLVTCVSRPAASSTDSRMRSPSPKLVAWEQAWQAIEAKFFTHWDPTTPASSGNCLLALSMLVGQHGDWVHDPALSLFVERQLTKLTPPTSTSAEGTSFGHADRNDATFRPTSIDINQPDPRGLSIMTPRPAECGEFTISSPGSWARNGTHFVTEYAGVFLLVRGLHDLRVAGMARHSGYPFAGAIASARLYLDLACQWMQQPIPEEVDFGLLEFARLGGAAEWQDFSLGGISSGDASDQFQFLLTKSLIGLGTWTVPHQMHVMVQESTDGRWIRGGDIDGRVYPWCARWQNPEMIESTIEHWRSQMSRCSSQPVDVLLDESVRVSLERSGSSPNTARLSAAMSVRNGESQRVENPCHEASLIAAADSVLRHWARSLRGLGASSNLFLLQNLIRRSGTIAVRDRHLEIFLEPRPMDAALRVSGMFDSLDLYVGKELVQIQFRTECERSSQ